MGQREQDLVDQHRRWREQIDARPEAPTEVAPREQLPPRSERLERRLAERRERMARRDERQPVKPRAVWVAVRGWDGPLVRGHHSLMGDTVEVFADSGRSHLVRIERLLGGVDEAGICYAVPVGRKKGKERTFEGPLNAELPVETMRSRRHSGSRRASRSK